MKQLWPGIKSIINIRKSRNVNMLNKLKDFNGNITSDPMVMANIFNKFFLMSLIISLRIDTNDFHG